MYNTCEDRGYKTKLTQLRMHFSTTPTIQSQHTNGASKQKFLISFANIIPFYLLYF